MTYSDEIEKNINKVDNYQSQYEGIIIIHMYTTVVILILYNIYIYI